jgi:hypothetical protein
MLWFLSPLLSFLSLSTDLQPSFPVSESNEMITFGFHNGVVLTLRGTYVFMTLKEVHFSLYLNHNPNLPYAVG